MPEDNVISMTRTRRSHAERDVLELQLQMAEVRAKINILLWGMGLLLASHVAYFFSHIK